MERRKPLTEWDIVQGNIDLEERRQAEALRSQMERQKSPPMQVNYRGLMGLVGAILFGAAFFYVCMWIRAIDW